MVKRISPPHCCLPTFGCGMLTYTFLKPVKNNYLLIFSFIFNSATSLFCFYCWLLMVCRIMSWGHVSSYLKSANGFPYPRIKSQSLGIAPLLSLICTISSWGPSSPGLFKVLHFRELACTVSLLGMYLPFLLWILGSMWLLRGFSCPWWKEGTLSFSLMSHYFPL